MRLFGLLLCGVMVSVSHGPADPPLVRFSYTEPHMGTTFKVILYAPDQARADAAAKAAFAKVASLDATMSDYRPTSELMQLCQKAGRGPVPVGDELFTVIAHAQKVSELSDGAFDITVGPVVRLWRRARKSHDLPDPEQLAAARALVGYRNVVVDEHKHTVELKKPGMLLDLGGIAKGYTADAVLALLNGRGITRALVAAGGDIAVSEPPPDADAWTIGIAPVEDPDAKPKRYVLLKNQAVSTSGDAEQYVEVGGKRYSHIVDPRTGIGLVGRSSVTVVAPKGIQSDSLTKVVAVLGPERGLPIIDTIPAVAAFGVRRTEHGKEFFQSKHFRDIPKKGADKN